MYRYYFRKSESGFHDWCERIYYCKELVSDYYHFSDDMKEYYKDRFNQSKIIVDEYKKLCESLNDTQKEILKEYYLNNKTIPWSISTEDKRIIYNNWEAIVFPNGVSRIKTVDVMSAASTIKEMRKKAGYNREEVAGILNISVATLRKYEDGKSLVRLDILVSMLQIYGDDMNDFLKIIDYKKINYFDL